MPLSRLADAALREISDIWQTGPAQTAWRENGFDWTPGSHLVRVRANSRDINGDEIVRVWVETDFLQDVPCGEQTFCNRLGGLAHIMSSTYSLVYPPAEIWKEFGPPANLSLFSSIYVSDRTASWLPGFCATMAVMQPICAEIRSALAPQWLRGGSPAYAAGVRASSPNGILEVADTFYAPVGGEPSRWIDCDEFERFAEEYGRSDWCFGIGDARGLTLETPFGHDSALIRFKTDEQHPQLKHGLFIQIVLPFTSTLDEASNEAAFLNYLEARTWTDVAQFGCWHIHPTGENQAVTAQTTFVPNALYRPGWVLNFFGACAYARARWVHTIKWPDLKDLSMAEILGTRYGPVRDPATPH